MDSEDAWNGPTRTVSAVSQCTHCRQNAKSVLANGLPHIDWQNNWNKTQIKNLFLGYVAHVYHSTWFMEFAYILCTICSLIYNLCNLLYSLLLLFFFWFISHWWYAYDAIDIVATNALINDDDKDATQFIQNIPDWTEMTHPENSKFAFWATISLGWLIHTYKAETYRYRYSRGMYIMWIVVDCESERCSRSNVKCVNLFRLIVNLSKNIYTHATGTRAINVAR